MRLQLTIALLLVAAPAHAQVADQEAGTGDVASSLAMYADSDKTTVVTTVVAGSVRLPQPVVIDAHALVDAVSSASVDVVSAATARFTENRVELGSTARIGLAPASEATLGYTHSGENDWQSHAVELGYSHDLAHKNAKLSIGYGFTRNDVGRAHDPTFERRLDVQGAQLGLAQVAGKKTLVTVAYTLTPRPLDTRGLRELVSREVIVVEPYLAGTSSRLVAAALSDVPHRALHLGVSRAEQRRYGTPADHARWHGLDAAGLRASINTFLPAGRA